MSDPFAAGMNALYRSPIAVNATYVPAAPGQDPFTVRVILSQPDSVDGFQDLSVVQPSAVFEVRAAEVESPQQGDMVEVSDETYVVQSKPQRPTPDRLVWRLDMRVL